MDIDKYIYEKENVISRDVCKEIIKLYESMPNKYYGHTASGIHREVKCTTDYNIPLMTGSPLKAGSGYNYEKEIWKDISNLLKKTLDKHIEVYMTNIYETYDHPNYKDIYIDSFLMHRYNKKIGKYITHTDNSVLMNPYTNMPVDRIVTFIFYINDVDEGGETELWKKIKIKPKAGKLLLFPSCWTFPHSGNIPISDDKYIITGWFYKTNPLARTQPDVNT